MSTQLILVVGIARSGTSLVCQALEKMGCYFGGPLAPGDSRNPKGFYEHLPIQKVHIRIMTGPLGIISQFKSTGIVDLPDAMEPYETALADLVAEELLNAGTVPFVVKDPRATQLIPLWKRVAERVGAEMRIIRCLRNPLSVYESMVLSEHFERSTASERLMLRVWAQYYAASEEHNPIDVWFEDWFQYPEKQADKLAAAVGLETPETDFVDHSLRRSG